MDECPVPKIPKPVLKGLHAAQTARNLAGAILASGAAGLTMYILNAKRKEKYRAFYAHYDANKAFERMNAKGVFSSIAK